MSLSIINSDYPLEVFFLNSLLRKKKGKRKKEKGTSVPLGFSVL